MVKLGLALDTVEAEGVCRRWDRDGSGTLDLEEFLRALRVRLLFGGVGFLAGFFVLTLRRRMFGYLLLRGVCWGLVLYLMFGGVGVVLVITFFFLVFYVLGSRGGYCSRVC